MTSDPREVQRRHYDHPPVVEAIVDIKAKTLSPPSFDALGQMVDGEEAAYPSRDTIATGEISIDLKSLSANTSQEMAGYRFTGANQDRVIQARRDGFSFSKLPPYADWETWQPEARRFWNRYVELAKPTRVTRIAVRYVNRIVVPKPAFEASDYFNCYPELPDNFGAIRQFVMRFEIPLTEPKGMLIFNHGILPRDNADTMPLLLDFDVFQEADMPPDGESLWEAIESLHRRENVFFESSITDLTRELFNGPNS